jgi:hypothetical protein
MAKKKEIELKFTKEEKQVIINISNFLISEMNTILEDFRDRPTHLLPAPDFVKMLSSQIVIMQRIKKNPDLIFNKSFEKDLPLIVNFIVIIKQANPVMSVDFYKSIHEKIMTIIKSNKEASELLQRSQMDLNQLISESAGHPKKDKKVTAEAAKIIKLNVSKKRTPRKRIN